MALEPTTTLMDALRQFRLLQPEQMDVCTRELEPRFPDSRTLARELVQRGWLTLYQVNELFVGLGQYLLLGSYVLLDKLGEGGMGTVFKARNWKLDKTVALKVIKEDRLIRPDVIRRFLREIRAAAQLDHPHIVRALDADEVQGTHFFVMEFVEGTDLHKLVKTRGPLPILQACDCIRQAALGLQHAFERGLVHRDIKPHNLLLTASRPISEGSTVQGSAVSPFGLVKVLDMGLALAESPTDDGHSSTITQTGIVMGTPDYMAPEQSRNAHRVDIRADLYSLGCTLYFLLAARAPFAGGSLSEKLLKHQMDEPDSVKKHRPDVSNEVDALIRKLLAKRPEERYQTPAELVQALEQVQRKLAARPALAVGSQTAAAQPVLAASAASDSEVAARLEWARFGLKAAAAAPPRPKWSSWRMALLAGLAGSALLVGGIWWAMKPAPEKKRPEPGPAEQQVEFVRRELKRLNPKFDGKVVYAAKDGVVTSLQFCTDEVTDIAPLQSLPGLQRLTMQGKKGPRNAADLAPLRGMKLTALLLDTNPVADLTPLKGMPLYLLTCGHTKVADLSPLQGMKLTALSITRSEVADLAPLEGMPLVELDCAGTNIQDYSLLLKLPLKKLNLTFHDFRDATIIRKLKSLETINQKPAGEFWKEFDARQAEFDKWCADVAKLPADKQAEQVAAELQKRNPDFDGKVTEEIKDQQIWSLTFHSFGVTDLSPVRALQHLTHLNISGDSNKRSKLVDLWPLRGMPLKHLMFLDTDVADLSPLAGSQLTHLNGAGTKVTDLTPLRGLPLERLTLDHTPVRDLTPLKGMELKYLDIAGTEAEDLSPLRSLQDLKEISIDFVPWRHSELLRSLPMLTNVTERSRDNTYREMPLAEVRAWADWDDAVYAVPLPEKIELLKAKLIELNGKHADVTRVYAGPMDKDKWGITDLICLGNFKDISPVRVFRDLHTLTLGSGSYDGPRAALADLAPLEGMKLKRLSLQGSEVAELAPLWDMALEWLHLGATRVTDLGPLRGMPLKELVCDQGPSITSLEPLSASKLETLNCSANPRLTSLNGLERLPLKWLDCSSCPIESLDPIKDCPLEYFMAASGTRFTHLAPLAGIKTLKAVHFDNHGPADLSQLKGLALESVQLPANVRDLFFLKDMPIKKFWGPFNPWRDRDVMQSLKRLESVIVVSRSDGMQTAAEFWRQVERERADFDAWVKKISALKPEEQVKAVSTELLLCNPELHETEIGKAWKLSKDQSAVIAFQVTSAKVTNLEPLRALPHLETLGICSPIFRGNLTDLWPLQGLKLKHLSLSDTAVKDLRPLAGMPLEDLDVTGTPAADLSPLLAVPISDLSCPFVFERDAAILRQIKTLKTINGKAKEEVLK